MSMITVPADDSGLYRLNLEHLENIIQPWEKRHNPWFEIEKAKFKQGRLGDLVSAEAGKEQFFNLLDFHIYTYYEYQLTEPIWYGRRLGNRWIITKDGEWAGEGNNKIHTRMLTDLGKRLWNS